MSVATPLIKVLSVERNERRMPRTPRDAKEFHSKPRVYFSVKGETILENLVERHVRPFTEYRKVLVAALESIGIDTSELKFNWSKYAGCTMCPCSPGFVVSRKDGRHPTTLGHCDIWITVGDDQEAVQDLEKREALKAATLKVNALKADLGRIESEVAAVALRAALVTAVEERNAI